MPTRLLLAGLTLSFLVGCGQSVDSAGTTPDGDGELVMVSNSAADDEEGAAAAADKKSRASGKPASGLIPREILFGNPDKASPRLSPDGKFLSYLAPVKGVLNVWVGPAGDPSKAKPVTKDTKRGIRNYSWAYTNNHILYTQDTDGDENWHIYSVELDSDKITDLTPIKVEPKPGEPKKMVTARIENVSHRLPNEILVGLNDRTEQLHDIYRINLATGERKLVQENPGFVGFVTDDDYHVRFGMAYGPTGATIFEPGGDKGWKEFLKIPSEDMLTTSPADFDKTGQVLYLIDSRGRDTSALTALDLKTGKATVIAESDKADVSGAMIHPTEKNIQAVSYNYTKTEWKVLDPAVAADFEYLRTLADGELSVASRTHDDKQWIVSFVMDNGPVRYYFYDRAAKKARFLFTNRNDLEDVKLAKMHPVVIKARDGLELVSYLTLPVSSDGDGDARPSEPLPLVLFVHGGPWARDNWGLNPYHQWLANRGYAVLSVNFRGSTGFGKKFLNAGDGEWAGKMHDDLLDAVNWAVEQKIADRKKVAIMGGSYGGYATLVGLTFTPDVFACGVDIVGPSNIITLLKTVPPYWAPFMPVLTRKVGDPSTPEGRKLLVERSPLTHVEKIVRPLLIGQGANDQRVKQAESDQIVQAMQAKKIPVCYVLYPDEGHGFARPENRMSFNAVTEAFLAKHLGGNFQPVGEDFHGSKITVPTGAEQVPGLSEALKALGAEDRE
jgi:dipeptidyl aminopeptidase/acylaminoacyl peptidase